MTVRLVQRMESRWFPSDPEHQPDVSGDGGGGGRGRVAGK